MSNKAKTRIHGQKYTIYPKKMKSGKVFYVEFRKPDGKFGVAKSTKCRTKSAAVTWAENYLNSGQVVTKENITLEAFAKDFFTMKSDWAKEKINYGKIPTERQLATCQAKLNNHILPAFGKMKLPLIDEYKIKDWYNVLRSKKLSGDTINSISNVLEIILTQAFEQKEKLIQKIPKIKKFSIDTKKRGWLTHEEMALLFKTPWSDFKRSTLDAIALELRTVNYLAAATGMRQGEIAGLRRGSVHPGYIDVKESWDTWHEKSKAPKTEKGIRFVPVPSKVQQALLAVMKKAKWKESDDFVFQGDKRNLPLCMDNHRYALYEMYGKIGIDKTERKTRRLTFHSHRHYFNSLLINAKISKFKVQAVVGHSNDAMTKNYYHPDDCKDVLLVQETTFR